MSSAAHELVHIETVERAFASRYLELWPDAPFSSSRELRIPCEPEPGNDYGVLRIPEEAIIWKNSGNRSLSSLQETALKTHYLGDEREHTSVLECIARFAGMTVVVASTNENASYTIEHFADNTTVQTDDETITNPMQPTANVQATQAPAQKAVMAQGEIVYVTEAA